MKIVISFFLFVSSTVFAKEMKVSISHIPPWILVENSDCSSGILCHLFNTLEKEVGVKVDFKITSLARANNAFFMGNQDFGFFPQKNDLKEKYILVKKALVYKSGIYSFKKLVYKKSKICTTIKNPHLINENYIFSYVKNINQCFKMLKNKRIDGVFITNVEMRYHEKRTDLSFLSKSTFHFQSDHTLWLYLNKKFKADTELISQIQNLTF